MWLCYSRFVIKWSTTKIPRIWENAATCTNLFLYSWLGRVRAVYAPIIWMKPSHSGTEWRELCMHLCNCVIQTSWFCVTTVIIRHWGCWGEDRPSVCTVSRQISVDSPQGRNASRLNHTSPPSTCSAQLLIKTAFVEPRTSSTAVDINFKWVVSRERVLPSDRVDSIKRQK